MTHLDAHGGRKSEAHCAKATGSDVAIGAGPGIVASRPHLVLPNIGDDNGLVHPFPLGWHPGC